MSILKTGSDVNKQPTASVWSISESKLTPKNYKQLGVAQVTTYKLTDKEAEVRNMILRHFCLGYITMYKPRVEFNDLSVINRDTVDQMAFNTYQPNNGEGFEGDEINGWKSKAIRPIVQNKCISIAAHATARLIFPKIFAYNESSDEDSDASQAMEYLMEWSGDKCNYEDTSVKAVVTSVYSPASIVYTEYAEVYRTVKRPTETKGVFKEEVILDELLSGFQDQQVPVDELYIENFYEPDIQKQGWLIRRRVISYSLAEAKYHDVQDFKDYVRPGVQLIYNDANATFYQMYDSNMRQEDVEEVIYWNRGLDLKVVLVNGVFMTPSDNPNPRQDKMYPFTKFGYQMINNRCFYYKSLAAIIQPDANIVNTLYPMIIDGTYLNIMPPMVAIGHEAIGSDVVVPGAVTTFSDPNADLRPITTSMNLKTGLETLMKVEDSINQSSLDPSQQGNQTPGSVTAYEISKIEQNAATVLGLFVKSISSFVKQYGQLRMNDILQYLTIAEAGKVEGEIAYKVFLLPDKSSGGSSMSRKIKFDSSVPTKLSPEDMLAESYKVMAEAGGPKAKVQLYKANPEAFRNRSYTLMVSPDVLNPRSEDLERAMDLETYDRAILNPMADQEAVTKDLLFATNPKTKKDPSKYVKKQSAMPPPGAPPGPGLNTPGAPSPAAKPPGAGQMAAGMPYQSPMTSAMKQKNTQVQAK